MAKFSFVLFAHVSWVLNISVVISPTSVQIVPSFPFKGSTLSYAPVFHGLHLCACQNADSDPEDEVRPRLWGAAGGLGTNNAH